MDMTIQELIKKRFPTLRLQKVLSDEEHEQQNVDFYNQKQGVYDGLYNCEICHNKGITAFLKNGEFTTKICECSKIRKTIRNIKKSGLTEELQSKTFNTFSVNEKWQENVKNIALEYLDSNDMSWFYAGGQSGSGKTHICTAICNEFLKREKSVKYIMYRDFIQKLSAYRFREEYHDIIENSMNYDVIYIDDFLKTRRINDEIGFVFDIINFADTRRKKLIISSEMFIENIAETDCAIASRIKQNARGFTVQIKNDMTRNFRL